MVGNYLAQTTQYRNIVFTATVPTLVWQINSFESDVTFAAPLAGNITRTYWQYKGSTFAAANRFTKAEMFVHIAGIPFYKASGEAWLRAGDSIIQVTQDPGVAAAPYYVHTILKMIEMPDRPQYPQPHPQAGDFSSLLSDTYLPDGPTVVDNPNGLVNTVLYDATF